MNGTRKNAISGLIWKFLERCSYQVVNFIITLVLARILSPDDYGNVAIILAIIAIMQVFVDSGMGTALVQKKNVDDTDYGTVFIANLLMSLCLYLLVYCMAPMISRFYEKDLTSVLRVLSSIILIFSVKNVYQAHIARNMLFQKTFIGSFFGIVIGGATGIVFATLGFGIWALVIQQLVSEALCTIILIYMVKWLPKLRFSRKSFFDVFGYGWKLLVSSLIDTLYNNIRQLIIGKYYSSQDLAFYSKGDQFPNIIVSNINSSMNTVLLPVMSKEQDDKNEIKRLARRIIRTSSYFLWPLMIGLFVVADNITELLLTEKWLPIVPYMRIFCIVYCLQPLQTTNLNVMKSLGHTDLCLKLEIIKKSIAFAIVFLTVKYGTYVVAVGALIYAIIASVINAFPNRKLIKYTYFEQIKDILPFVAMSCIMGVFVWGINVLKIQGFILVFSQFLVGAITYVFLSMIFKIDCFLYLLEIIKELIKVKKR